MLPHHEVAPTETEAVALTERLSSLIPKLQTKRLRLRAPKIADFSAYAEIALSPRGRFILKDQNREDAWYDFVNMVACWLLSGHGLRTVERHDDDELVGFVLIGFEPSDHEPELGYMFSGRAEGSGYATEAAHAVMQYASEKLGFTTLVSTIDHDNAGSLNVAQKLGGVRDLDAEQAHDNKVIVLRYSSAAS